MIQDFVSKEKFSLKCPYNMVPEFIVIHNTANDASAKNEVSYMKNSSSSTSFHFAVDDVEVRQALPLDRNAWHAGDGTNGKGNRKGIAVEICYSKTGGEKFLKAEENAANFVAKLLKEYGWDIDRVKKHQDFSGKYCPHRTIDLGWNRFIKMVQNFMDESITPEEVVKTFLKLGVITAEDYWLKRFREDNSVFCMAKNWISYMEKI